MKESIIMDFMSFLNKNGFVICFPEEDYNLDCDCNEIWYEHVRIVDTEWAGRLVKIYLDGGKK